MIMAVRVRGFGGRFPAAVELSLFELEASSLRCFPLAGFGLADELVEVGVLFLRHFALGPPLIDRAGHAPQPIGIAGRAGGSQRSNQVQMIVADGRGPVATNQAAAKQNDKQRQGTHGGRNARGVNA